MRATGDGQSSPFRLLRGPCSGISGGYLCQALSPCQSPDSPSTVYATTEAMNACRAPGPSFKYVSIQATDRLSVLMESGFVAKVKQKVWCAAHSSPGADEPERALVL